MVTSSGRTGDIQQGMCLEVYATWKIEINYVEYSNVTLTF